MKKISGIKLNQFRKDELEKRELNALKGGSGICFDVCSMTSCESGCERCGDVEFVKESAISRF